MKRELKEETFPFLSEKIAEHDGIGCYQAAPPRWNSPCGGEGAYPLRSSNQSASTSRAQLSVAAKVVRPTDLLNHVKT